MRPEKRCCVPAHGLSLAVMPCNPLPFPYGYGRRSRRLEPVFLICFSRCRNVGSRSGRSPETPFSRVVLSCQIPHGGGNEVYCHSLTSGDALHALSLYAPVLFRCRHGVRFTVFVSTGFCSGPAALAFALAEALVTDTLMSAFCTANEARKTHLPRSSRVGA